MEEPDFYAIEALTDLGFSDSEIDIFMEMSTYESRLFTPEQIVSYVCTRHDLPNEAVYQMLTKLEDCGILTREKGNSFSLLTVSQLNSRFSREAEEYEKAITVGIKRDISSIRYILDRVNLKPKRCHVAYETLLDIGGKGFLTDIVNNSSLSKEEAISALDKLESSGLVEKIGEHTRLLYLIKDPIFYFESYINAVVEQLSILEKEVDERKTELEDLDSVLYKSREDWGRTEEELIKRVIELKEKMKKVGIIAVDVMEKKIEEEEKLEEGKIEVPEKPGIELEDEPPRVTHFDIPPTSEVLGKRTRPEVTIPTEPTRRKRTTRTPRVSRRRTSRTVRRTAPRPPPTRHSEPVVKRSTENLWVKILEEGEEWLRIGYGYGSGHTSKDLLDSLKKHGPIKFEDLTSYRIYPDEGENIMDILEGMERKGAIELYEEKPE